MSKWVVHCKREPYDVYVGRPSQWGNPFRLDEHGPRDEVIAEYREHILRTPGAVAKIRQDLSGKVLGCWCSPKPCHADVLAEIANTPTDANEVGE